MCKEYIYCVVDILDDRDTGVRSIIKKTRTTSNNDVSNKFGSILLCRRVLETPNVYVSSILRNLGVKSMSVCLVDVFMSLVFCVL